MGFRFRKSIKILPGIKLNVTHKGISSASIGRAGASVNIGKKGTRTTVGLPGTGLSYSKFKRYQNDRSISQYSSESDENNSTPPHLASSPKGIGKAMLIVCMVIAFILGVMIF